jgi:hypothetical protein
MTSHATLNGTITATGGENCDQRGFEWGYSPGSYPNSWTENGSFGTGSFSHQVTGLNEYVTCYYRAKAHNSAGWGYGGEQSFHTATRTTRTLSQNATIKASGQTQTLSQNGRLIALGQTQTIPQDARLFTTTSQTIDQNAKVKALGEQNLESDATIVGANTQTISQDAVIVLPGQIQNLDATAFLKASTSQPLSQNALVRALGQTQSLQQDAYLGPAVVRPLLQDATIAPGLIKIDTFTLPHVLTLSITYEVVMVKKPIQNGSLPRCKMVGKEGRTVQITGWTKYQADIATMEALKDGTTRTFYHPSGDSFSVLISNFQASKNVDRQNRRTYQLKIVEEASG